MSFLVSVFKPLAYISLPIILIRSFAASSPVGRYYTRMAVYVGALATVGSCSVVIAAGMTLIGRSTDVNSVVGWIFYALVGRALDLKVEVEGENHLDTRPAVFMTAIMAKKSLQFSPLGPFMSLSGTIFIDRGNNAKAIHSIDVAGKRMQSTKTSLWMFPEGTRFLSREPDMLPLKKGGFHLALNAGISIVPIVIENYWHMYRQGVFESGIIKVRVLRPISTIELTAADAGTLAARVRHQMLDTLRDLSANSEPEDSDHEKKSGSLNPSEQMESTISTALTPGIGIELESHETIPDASESFSSLASSLASSHGKTLDSNETGAETEEDEGMIIVGRVEHS